MRIREISPGFGTLIKGNYKRYQHWDHVGIDSPGKPFLMGAATFGENRSVQKREDHDPSSQGDVMPFEKINEACDLMEEKKILKVILPQRE
jgi:hypothetical protein